VPEADQFGTLADLVREGKIRYVGLSEAGVDEMERARRDLPIVSVQNRYNVADRTWDAVVEYCTRERLAFIPWFPLGAGPLDIPAQLERVAARQRAMPLQVALAWLLARSPIVLPIPGTAKVSHLEENVAAASITLTAEDRSELDAVQSDRPPRIPPE
jgi:pyridoxine 4-dehydrogenase